MIIYQLKSLPTYEMTSFKSFGDTLMIIFQVAIVFIIFSFIEQYVI